MHKHLSRNTFIIRCGLLRAVFALLLAAGAAACTSDTLLSPDGARPHANLAPLLSLTPDSAVVGDTGVVLTLRGSGFNESTWLGVSPWLPLTITVVDDSTITARIEGPLWEAATHEVTTFDENYQQSDPLYFTVTNPAPVIDAMTPDACEVDGDCQTVTLRGRNFLQGAQLLWDGSPVNFTLQGDSVITVQLQWHDLAYEDVTEVTVVNPGPGGGPSAPAIFQVGPRLVMHTHGATAGGSGFQLVIYGEGLGSDATVHWNGSPRQTWFHNANRISAVITAADLATAGTAVVTITTGLLASGAPWRVGTVTVRPQPSASVTSQVTLELPVRDLVYSAYTDRLYGTVYDGPMAGNLAVIDPATGTVEDYTWLGSSPRYLAVSEDGKHLWAGVDGENQVRRVNLEWGTSPDFTVQLDPGIVAEDLAVVPRYPHRVAVSRRDTSGSPAHAGVAVYNFMWPLSSTTAAGAGSNVIEFGATGSTLYGLDNETSAHRFRTMSVDDDGVAVASHWWSGLSAGADIVYAGGRLYSSEGPVMDTGYRDWVSTLYGFSGAVRPDLATGRAFFLGDDAIRVADINTAALLGTLPVPTLAFEPAATQRRHLVRWSTDGLAFHDADQVFLLRSLMVGP
jgi:hypothetical protein